MRNNQTVRPEDVVIGGYLKDPERNRLYEVINRLNNTVVMIDTRRDCDDPYTEPVTWLLSEVTKRLELVLPAPDWASIATEAEWGAAG